MKVLTTPEVRQYLRELSCTLYEKEYFGHLDSAEKYVEKLLFDIQANLPTKPHRLAPARFGKFGEGLHYAAFRSNRATTWYAFFTRHNDANGEAVFIVRHIANNHVIARHL
jgi:hypothetical protein